MPDEIVSISGKGERGIDMVGAIGYLIAVSKELAGEVLELKAQIG